MLGLAAAYTAQAGWVILATFFALDVWIIFGMVLMLVRATPDAPSPLLTLAFILHAVCMYLTTIWSSHARNLSTLAGGAVVSALTLSALAVTMGGGYTKYREVTAGEATSSEAGDV